MKSYQPNWTPKSKKTNVFLSRSLNWKILRSCQSPSHLKLLTNYNNVCKRCWQSQSAAPEKKKRYFCSIHWAKNHLKQRSYIEGLTMVIHLKLSISSVITKDQRLRWWNLRITMIVLEALLLLSGSLRIRASVSMMNLRLCSTLLKHDHLKSKNQMRLSTATRAVGHSLDKYWE